GLGILRLLQAAGDDIGVEQLVRLLVVRNRLIESLFNQRFLSLLQRRGVRLLFAFGFSFDFFALGFFLGELAFQFGFGLRALLFSFRAGLAFVRLGNELVHFLTVLQLAGAGQCSQGRIVPLLGEALLSLLDQLSGVGRVAGLGLLAAGGVLGVAALAFLFNLGFRLGQLLFALLAGGGFLGSLLLGELRLLRLFNFRLGLRQLAVDAVAGLQCRGAL